jgi:hypothetical protein
MKAHLIFTDTPLGTGSHGKSVCGTDIWNLQALFLWDETRVTERIEFPVNVCRKCVKAADSQKNKRQYVYGVAEQSESRD